MVFRLSRKEGLEIACTGEGEWEVRGNEIGEESGEGAGEAGLMGM